MRYACGDGRLSMRPVSPLTILAAPALPPALCGRRVQLTLHTPASNHPLSLQGTYSTRNMVMRGVATGGDTGSVTLDRAAGNFDLELEADEADSEAGAGSVAGGLCTLARLPALTDTITAQTMLQLPTSDVVL